MVRKNVSVRLDEEARLQVEDIAEARDLTVADVLRQAVARLLGHDDYLERQLRLWRRVAFFTTFVSVVTSVSLIVFCG